MSFEVIVDVGRQTSNDHNSSPWANGSGELKSVSVSQSYCKTKVWFVYFTTPALECSGPVVECLTLDRVVAGSSLTGVTVFQQDTSNKNWFNPEDLSWHNWKFVDWYAKNQIKTKQLLQHSWSTHISFWYSLKQTIVIEAQGQTQLMEYLSDIHSHQTWQYLIYDSHISHYELLEYSKV